MTTNRKDFLKQVTAAGAGLAIPGMGLNLGSNILNKAKNKIKNPIGCSTYSFSRFNQKGELLRRRSGNNGKRFTVEMIVDIVSKMGFDGLEILKPMLENGHKNDAFDNIRLQNIKRQALLAGIDLIALDTFQNFLSSSKEDRKKNLEKTKKQIELAYSLGIPVMRVQTGHWDGSPGFTQLMKNKGAEQPPEGTTREDGFKWVIDNFQQCIPKAKECGVIIAMENHWGLGRKPEWLNRIRKGVNSKWFKFVCDTGNVHFLDDPYKGLAQLAPYAAEIQAKTYFGGGVWFDNRMDFKRVAKIFHDVGYRGYVSLEFEGKGNPYKWVPKSLEILRSSFS